MGEAVRILGVSATTIRRKIEAGELEAERVTRPQGVAWLVRVAADPPSPAVAAPSAHQDPPATPQDPPGNLHHAPTGTDLLTVVVAPLLAEVAASRQTIERQAEQLVRQAETIGRLAAENDALKGSQAKQEANPGPVVPAPATGMPRCRPRPACAPWRLGAGDAAI